MTEIVTELMHFLGSGQDPLVRNVVASLLCIALYGLYIAREGELSSHRARRPRRSPDSILRSVGH